MDGWMDGWTDGHPCRTMATLEEEEHTCRVAGEQADPWLEMDRSSPLQRGWAGQEGSGAGVRRRVCDPAARGPPLQLTRTQWRPCSTGWRAAPPSWSANPARPRPASSGCCRRTTATVGKR